MRHTLFFPSSVELRQPAPGADATNTDPIRAVESAVRAVLGELLRPVGNAVEGEAVFAERLFLLRHAEALPRGTREIRIAPGTVVTPLAIQALKQREIAVRFVSRSEVETVQRRGEWAFGIEVQSGVVEAFRRVLLESAGPWVELPDGPTLVEWVAGSAERGALLVTEEASVAVWRACQVPGVRAAAAESCEAAARAVRNLGVNVLVVEPAGKSIAFLKQLGQTLRAGGAPRAPMPSAAVDALIPPAGRNSHPFPTGGKRG
jgi:hypothetical protein